MWNRIAALMILVGATSLLMTPGTIEARGGGGRAGGGARGGGSYSGGQVMNRTPTMSRTSSRPATSQAKPQARPATTQARSQVQARPQARQQAQTRPSASQQAARVQQSRQAAQQRPSAANRTDLRNQVNRYAQSRPGQNPLQNLNHQALLQRTQSFSNNRGSQMAQNRQLSNRASQRLQQSRPDYNQWFGDNFFNRHAINADYLRTRANWWRPAAWSTLANWGNWGWSEPYYYDDAGYSYPVTTTESAYPATTTQPAGSAYAYPTSTAPSYSQPPAQAQSTQIAATTPEGDWLPLGVFAVGNNPIAAVQSNRFIQLAVSRGGEIAGVLYNSTTDRAQDLVGMVDPNTQKAYWALADRTDSPIASTGIYNLTEDQTSINVHFANGSDQTWALVRLQQEADGNAISDEAERSSSYPF